MAIVGTRRIQSTRGNATLAWFRINMTSARGSHGVKRPIDLRNSNLEIRVPGQVINWVDLQGVDVREIPNGGARFSEQDILRASLISFGKKKGGMRDKICCVRILKLDCELSEREREKLEYVDRELRKKSEHRRDPSPLSRSMQRLPDVGTILVLQMNGCRRLCRRSEARTSVPRHPKAAINAIYKER